MKIAAGLCLLVVGLSGAVPACRHCSGPVPAFFRVSVRLFLLVNIAAGLVLAFVTLLHCYIYARSTLSGVQLRK
jgi:hypothetical protein